MSYLIGEFYTWGLKNQKLTWPYLAVLLTSTFFLTFPDPFAVANDNFGQLEPSKQQVQLLLSSGDRFLEHGLCEEAVKQYKMAIEVDPLSVDVHSRFVDLYRSPNKSAWCWKGKAQFSDFLRPLYVLQSITPALQEDIDFLWDEAKIISEVRGGSRWYGWGSRKGIPLLETLISLAPQDPRALLKLGPLLIKEAEEDPKKKRNGLALIRKGVAIEPENVQYRVALADALAANNLPGDALKEYQVATKLIANDNQAPTRKQISQKAIELFSYVLEDEGDKFRPQKVRFSLNIPLKEQVALFRFFRDIGIIYIAPTNWGPQHDRRGEIPIDYWLAKLSFTAKEFQQADRLLEGLRDLKGHRYLGKAGYEFWIEVLETSGHDPEKLSRVRKEFDDKFGEKEHVPSKKERK